jgi:pyruvate formate lyase activating enzyme
MSAARHWQQLPDGRLECGLCPSLCKLADGERGRCRMRLCQAGALVFSPPGRSCGVRIEPIEALSLAHFLPGTLALSVGKGGTNLVSRWQSNGISRNAPMVDRLPELTRPEEIASWARELGCATVALGCTEPTVMHDYAIDVARACRAAGVKTAALSRGYVCPQPRAEFYRHIDAARIELLAFQERFYWKYCDAHVAPVLDTLLYLARHTKVWLEVDVPLVPRENETVRELEAMCCWMARELGRDVPLHFKLSHLIASGSADDLQAAEVSAARAQRIARICGLRYVYTDELFNPQARTTTCHRCGELLIAREWFTVSGWRLSEDNRCPSCDAACAGVFVGRPSAWGAHAA